MPQQEFKRKLTTILSADVAGYSRLMADNEEETVHTIKSYRIYPFIGCGCDGYSIDKSYNTLMVKR